MANNNKPANNWQPLKREKDATAPPPKSTTPPAKPASTPTKSTVPPTKPTNTPPKPGIPPTKTAVPPSKPATSPTKSATPPPTKPPATTPKPPSTPPKAPPEEAPKDFKSWQPKSAKIPSEERIPKKPSAPPPPQPPVEEILTPKNTSALSGDKIPPHPDIALLYATTHPQPEVQEDPLPETFQTWKPKASQIPPEDRVPKPGEHVVAQSQRAWEKNANTKVARPAKSPGHRKHSAAVPIGGLFVFLALIGLVTVVMFSIRATERLIDNSKEKERFENILLPVIMFDPVPFEDPNEIGELALLRTSIWSTVIQNNEKYSFNDGNMVTVPKSDVDVACAKLFGSQVTLKHQSFDDDNSIYSYNQETLTYFVPLDTSIRYTPQVEGISKKGDTLSLTVGYLAPDNQWMMSLRGETKEPTPSKYMLYEMEKVDGEYLLTGIKDPPGGAVPGIPQISPQQQQPLQPVTPTEKIPPEALEQQLPMNPEDQTRQQEETGQEQTPPDAETGTDTDPNSTTDTNGETDPGSETGTDSKTDTVTDDETDPDSKTDTDVETYPDSEDQATDQNENSETV